VLDAEVVAVDGHDRPAILRKRHGDGQAVLCCYPLEQLAAAQGRVNPEATWRVYRALAADAGAVPPVTVADPQVLVDALVHDGGTRFVWLVSESDAEVKARPRLSDGADGSVLQTLDGDPVGEVVALPPYGVAVLRLAVQSNDNQETST
jgi:hypothetical protein